MGEEEQMRYAWRVVDLIVGGIFVYAGVSKVLDPAQFANDVDNYKTLPWFVSVRLKEKPICDLTSLPRCR